MSESEFTELKDFQKNSDSDKKVIKNMKQPDLFDLTGKTAVVVGGRGFLGKRFCNVLQAYGATVFSLDKETESKAALKEDNSKVKINDQINQLVVDVRDENSIKTVIEKIVQVSNTIDIFIYAVTTKSRDYWLPITECTLEGWREVLSVELDGAFLFTKYIGKEMEKHKKGSMIFISSIYGVVGNDQRIYEGSNLDSLYCDISRKNKNIYSHGVYNAAKGGIIAYVKYLAAYWGQQGIRVNALSPGGIQHSGENEDFVQKYSARVPMGRKGNPDEMDGTVVYLASDASSYLTGQNIVVDGGWTIW